MSEASFGAGFFISRTYQVPTSLLRTVFSRLEGFDFPIQAASRTKLNQPFQAARPGALMGQLPFATLHDAVSRFHAEFEEESQYFDMILRHEVSISLKELADQAKRNRRAEDFRPMVPWNQDLVYKCFRTPVPNFERLFFTFDISENSTKVSYAMSCIIFLAIIISSLAVMLQTLPGLALVTVRIILHVELSCVIVFTVDYSVRLTTAPFVRLELLDLEFMQELLSGKTSRRLLSRRERLVRFVISATSIVDILSVVPFWIELAIKGLQGMAEDDKDVSGFLRALRCTRLLRVLKLGKVTSAYLGGEDRTRVWQLFGEVLKRARYALQLFALLVVLAMLIFGSLIWFAERGTLIQQGEEACPDDAPCANVAVWLRQANAGYESSPSPFTSIPVSFWWVLVTITKVGYGDHFPVTRFGYVIGTATILYGSVVCALPVGIIATAFAEAYAQLEKHNQARGKTGESLKLQQAAQEQAQTASHDHRDEPPAVFIDLWRAVHRTALTVGIPMNIANAWKSRLFEVSRFEGLALEHPCDSLQTWGEPIFATLGQYVSHSACSATQPLLRLRTAWYALLFQISTLQCNLPMQERENRRAFDQALRGSASFAMQQPLNTVQAGCQSLPLNKSQSSGCPAEISLTLQRGTSW